jgi:hypothetical protein
MNEMRLMKLYMDVTGASESVARAVLMHVTPAEPLMEETHEKELVNKWKEKEPVPCPSRASWFVETPLIPAPA